MAEVTKTAGAYSTYENYEQKCLTYDNARRAVSVPVVLGAVADAWEHTGTSSISESVVAEIGCGTGNYIVKLAPHVKRLIAIDASQGMLNKCKDKAEQHNLTNIEYHQGDAQNLIGIPDESVDVVVACQILHHLPVESITNYSHPEQRFAGASRMFHEALRVLKPGGSLVLNVTLKEHMTKGFWFLRLVPKACERHLELVPTYTELQSMLKSTGFDDDRYEVYVDRQGTLTRPEVHNAVNGPLDDEWRSYDSSWTLVPDEDLQKMKDYITSMSPEEWTATAQKWIGEGKEVGMSSTHIAHKPIANDAI